MVRQSFRPPRITTLFVGESPPDSGDFFYNCDSRLYFRIKEAFGNAPNFLSEFKAKGFFLDDLVHYPINQIKNQKERNEHRWKAARPFGQRLQKYHPASVVILMRAIEAMVVDAMDQAGLSSVRFYVTPFPIFPRNVKVFQEKMAAIIPNLPVNGSHP